MKRSLRALAVLSLLAAAGPLAAQAPAAAPAPAPTPQKPAATQPAEPRKPLILRLDEIEGPPMSFGRSASEKETPKDLPSLGGDARQTQQSLRPSPYPKTSDDLP